MPALPARPLSCSGCWAGSSRRHPEWLIRLIPDASAPRDGGEHARGSGDARLRGHPVHARRRHAAPRRGPIVGVEAGGADLPAGVEVTEYAGTVLPGLIDCHTHLVAGATFGGLERAGTMSADELDAVILGSLRAHGEAGATTVRDLGDRDYRTLAFRDRSGLPRVVASGPPITSRDGHCHFLGGAVDGDLRTAVRERVDRGVDVIKVMASGGFATPGSDMFGAQFTVAEITTIVETAHDASLPVVAHAHSLLGMENALAAGADGIEHFTGLTAGGPRFDPALLDETARRGVYVDLTMGNDRSLHSRMPDPPPVVAQLLAGLGVRTFDEFYTSRLGVLSLLREHGVTVIAGWTHGWHPSSGTGTCGGRSRT